MKPVLPVLRCLSHVACNSESSTDETCHSDANVNADPQPFQGLEQLKVEKEQGKFDEKSKVGGAVLFYNIS